MSGIFSKTLSEVKPSLLTSGMGIGNTHRRISLGYLPPDNKNPLVRKFRSKGQKRKRNRKRSTGQRSFRSLVDDFGSSVHEPIPDIDERDLLNNVEDYNDYYDDIENRPHDARSGDEISRTTSLPSMTSENSEVEANPDVDWILQEHDRRYSSAHRPTSEEEIAPDSSATEGDVDYGSFMNRVQTRRKLYKEALREGSQGPRRQSLMSVTSRGSIPHIYQESLDEESLRVLAHEHVTYRSEAKVLASYSLPLMFTFLLEDIFPLVCSLTVGYLGKNELAAVSLASMTSNITLGFFEGIATSLDTLCPQAYGAGRYYSVGVHLQRCVAFSLVIYIPFALFWYYSEPLLMLVVPEKELVHLTAQFLKVLIFGAPAYIFFENLKRFLQAQGIFDAGIYVLLICAPLNIVMSWTLVWNKYIGIGFIGSAVAVVINFWLMFFLLLMYVIFIEGKKCWGGFSRKAFTHWRDLMHLAFSGVIMLEAEEISYECLTLFSAYFGTEYLAAQSAVSSVAALIYMVPFAIGISTSTRIANFIGAKRIDFAHISAKVGLSFSFIAGITNCTVLVLSRNFVAGIFSRDEKVKGLISGILPVVGFIQNFDSLNAVAGSCLRGQGMQSVGSIVNLVGYYCFGIPLAMILSWVFDWKLYGLWIGIGCAMLVVGSIESYFVLQPNWDRILSYAEKLREQDRDEEEEEYFSDSSDDEGDEHSSSSEEASHRATEHTALLGIV
ncbi:similar to Saccharomyces cerevisiae YDR338C Putative protein of unknown function [Maudiozyma barnettii]|uniref:Uncharacterized protein n=1 Tax=Maudiozyma barnettii TaxID=61262 RepID=A0A8H2VES0_9SACH|nr:hypothetical protein [Kazachstania barnettii]CAB4253783.1 similar to Saccharomyces cerevisiae YDR338C Putative protein of unknown function [Kazachstania barnettii]CAD1781532.1 similar to Saccharomyces cerevisiae YDR338C Putative protein of unknown function [Kazachstania barnettii]